MTTSIKLPSAAFDASAAATTSSSSSLNNNQAWAYFFAGALLPTLAWFFSLRQQKQQSNKKRSISGGNDDSDDEGEDDDEGGNVPANGSPCSSWNISHAPYKLVLLVNQELGMGKGKIAAQCSHAAVGCYKRASKACPTAVQAWECTGCAKIALKCPTEMEMQDIAVRALEKDIPCYLVEDAGRTQIAAGSRTVLGLGPAPVSVFEGVSDHLKLM